MCDCEAELALSVWFILTVELYPLSGLVTLPQKHEYVLPSFVNFMHTKKKKKKKKEKKRSNLAELCQKPKTTKLYKVH